MGLSEIAELITFLGFVIVAALVLIIPIYHVAVRKPQARRLHVLWALFWRGPILILLGMGLRAAHMDFFSACLVLLVIIGPLELYQRVTGNSVSNL